MMAGVNAALFHQHVCGIVLVLTPCHILLSG